MARGFKRKDPGKDRLDKIAKEHNIDYSHAKSLKDKHEADDKMIQSISRLPERKTNIMLAKVKLKFYRKVVALRAKGVATTDDRIPFDWPSTTCALASHIGRRGNGDVPARRQMSCPTWDSHDTRSLQ